MATESTNNFMIQNIFIIIIVFLILISTFTPRMGSGIKKFGYNVKFWFKRRFGNPFLY